MPPGQPSVRFACLPCYPAFALCLLLAAIPARAASLDLSLSGDVLSAGPDGGASHALVALDNPTAVMTDDQPAPALDPAALDPAVARPGDILQTGVASWYGSRWKGRRTASGSRFNPDAMTAASPTLPLGTRVLVTLEGTARSVLVTITDRQGAAARIIDLSRAAARRIGLLGRGTARVVLRRA